MKQSELYDAIIIGAGMSGFGAGIRLAMYDKKVCMLEQHSVWGGLNSFYKQGGRQFDVGLHALTNFSTKGQKRGPLPTILRQLRLSWDDFDLYEQNESKITFPDKEIRFNNEIDFLKQSIKDQFPDQIDGFVKLCEMVQSHDDSHLPSDFVSSKQKIKTIISSNKLIDMIFCPLMFYGSPTEHDMDWNQFVIMFKSIFFEGFSRPHAGVRKILSLLRHTYVNRGGELKMKSSVKTIKPLQEGGAIVYLDSGEELRAKKVFSSAGLPETQQLLGLEVETSDVGKLSFVESIFCLNKRPRDLDINSSIQFFSHQHEFKYQRAVDLVDYSSGILCSPNNFKDPQDLNDNIVRLTHIANPQLWKELRLNDRSLYNEAKDEMVEKSLLGLKSIIPDFSEHIEYIDTFTPATIERFTRRIDGAVYGSPRKIGDGATSVKDVYLCGTDQGYLGIVGSLLSGIVMANRHALT